jgi:hypothetical protein
MSTVTEVKYSQYFDDDFHIPIPNDIMGIIVGFIDPTVPITINKLNKVLKQFSNYDFWRISNDFDNRFPYNKNINYSNYKFEGRCKQIQNICLVVKIMPLLYEPDNRKNYKNGLCEFEKHNIESILHSGFTSTFRGSHIYICKIKLENKQHYISKYLKKPKSYLSYISRRETILAFMISGFQRDSPDTFTFKCKQVRLTKQIIKQNIDLFLQYKNVDDKTIFKYFYDDDMNHLLY